MKKILFLLAFTVTHFAYAQRSLPNGGDIGETVVIIDAYGNTGWDSIISPLTFPPPFSVTSGTVTIPAATDAVDGYLDALDFTDFANKQDAMSANAPVSITSGTVIAVDTTRQAGAVGTVFYVDSTVSSMSTSYGKTPQEYGAIGDGITDDTSPIRQCLAANDAVVFFGSYLITDTLGIKEGQKIYSNNATITFSTTTKAALTAFNANDWQLSGKLTIVGAGKANNTAIGLKISGCRSFNVQDLTITDISGHGIHVLAGADALPRGEGGFITNCWVKDSWSGIEFSAGSEGEYNCVTDFNCTGNNYGAVVAAGNITFTGGNIVDNTNGLFLGGGTGVNNSHGIFNGVNMNHNTNYNLYCYEAEHGETFSGCHFYGTGTQNIDITNSYGMTFTGCIIDGKINNVDSNTPKGFHFFNGCQIEPSTVTAGYTAGLYFDRCFEKNASLWSGNTIDYVDLSPASEQTGSLWLSGMAKVGELQSVYSAANDITGRLIGTPTVVQLASTYNATGSYVPLGIYTSDILRMIVDENGLIGVGTATPNTSALLDLTSDTLGFLPPRMTTAQKNAISTPTTGLMVYDTDLSAINTYDGAAWAGGGSNMANASLATDATYTVTLGGYDWHLDGGGFYHKGDGNTSGTTNIDLTNSDDWSLMQIKNDGHTLLGLRNVGTTPEGYSGVNILSAVASGTANFAPLGISKNTSVNTVATASYLHFGLAESNLTNGLKLITFGYKASTSGEAPANYIGTQGVLQGAYGNANIIFGTRITEGILDYPTTKFTIKTTGAINFTPMTATAASAITAVEGDVVMVSNTNGTFTSIGLWAYMNGAWAAL